MACIQSERIPHRGGMITLSCNVLGCQRSTYQPIRLHHCNYELTINMLWTQLWFRLIPMASTTTFVPCSIKIVLSKKLWWGFRNEVIFATCGMCFPPFVHLRILPLFLSPCTLFLLPFPLTGSFLIPEFDRLGLEWEWSSLPSTCHLPARQPHLS